MYEPKTLTAILPKRLLDSDRHKVATIRVSPIVAESAALDATHVYAKLNTRPEGLTGLEAQQRLEQYGPNVLAKDQRPGVAKLLWHAVLNPLVILLAVAGDRLASRPEMPGPAT